MVSVRSFDNQRNRTTSAMFSDGVIHHYNFPQDGEKTDVHHLSTITAEVRIVQSKVSYYRITTNLSISKINGSLINEDPNELYTLFNMKHRGRKRKPILQVYVNGLKVPDEEIYGFMMEDKTDILIPIQFLDLNDESFEIIFEKKEFKKYSYINRYYRNTKSVDFTFDLSYQEYSENRLLTSDMMMVFFNGKYIHLDNTVKVTMDTVNRRCTVSIKHNNFDDNGNLEIIFDSNIRYINTKPLENINNLYIPENYAEMYNLINGIIPKENCYFFANNKKIYSHDLNQIGRMNYVLEYREPITKDLEITTILTDRKIYDSLEYNMYGADYYLSNIVGVKGISLLNTLTDENENDILHKNEISEYLVKKEHRTVKVNNENVVLNYQNILTNNNFLYQYKKLEDIYYRCNSISTYFTKIKALLDNKLEYNSTMVRNILNFFGKQVICFETTLTEKDLKKEYIGVSFNEEDEINEEYEYRYMVIINGIHINETDHFTVMPTNKDVIQIKSIIFKLGVNNVYINKFKEYKNNIADYILVCKNVPKYTSCDYIIKESNNIRFKTFKSIIKKDDYICLVPYYGHEIEENPMVRNGIKTWIPYERLYDGLDITINNDGTTTVTFNEDFNEDFVCIQSKRFNLKLFNINNIMNNPEEGVYGKSFYLSQIHFTLNIPLIANESTRVFKNGEMLIPERDYKLISLINNPNVGYSKIKILSTVYNSDKITVYFSEIDSKVVMNRYTSIENKYGLLYFGNINYQYSPRYIDLYINDRYIYPSEIEILSDKLIRVPCVSEIMFNVYAVTSFGINEHYLQDYISSYKKSDFEAKIEEWFGVTNLNDNEDFNEEDFEKVNKIFESFDSNVSEYLKMPNPNDLVALVSDNDEFIETDEGLILII